jgi:ABC-type multidrug transport system fused ATPase/permease subunit
MRADETSLSMKSKMNEVNDDESSELKSLVSKLEKELTEVKGEVTSLKKDIKQVKESEAFLHFQKKKKSISFFQLMSVQSEKSDIILFIIAIIGSMAAGLSMPLISLLLGDVIDGFDGSIPKEEVPGIIKKAIINFIIACVCIFLGSLMMVFFWTKIGESFSKSLKVDYFRELMRQDNYLDSRKMSLEEVESALNILKPYSEL